MYTRRFLLAVPAVATAVALAGCSSNSTGASSHDMNGHTASTKPKTSSTAGSTAAAHNAADVMFAQGMIPHHEQAVEMAKLAASRAANREVKKVAQQIQAAQDPEIILMTGWLKRWGQPTGMPDMGMDHSMGGMMSAGDMTRLRGLSGRAFDRAFLDGMTQHHRGAISMAQAEQKDGRHPAAVKLAGRIITGQSAEITTMAGLRKLV